MTEDLVPTAVLRPNRYARMDWDAYFIAGAEWASLRADCTRRQVGAVVVDNQRRIVATGYNGSAPGGPSCLEGQCPRGTQSIEALAPGTSYDTGAGACVALHAEQNAVMYASMDQRRGASLYVTCEPCDGCWRMLAGSGIERVYWPVPDDGKPTYLRSLPGLRLLAYRRLVHGRFQ